MATPINAAGDARSDNQQPDRINLQASLSQSPDITTDAEPFSSSPTTEQQHLVQPKITFKYDAALLYASEDEDLAEDVMKEMNKLTLKNGRNVKVICYDHPEFGGSVIARPRQVLKKCRFVFSLLTNTYYDKVADYTNEEAVAYSKLHTERPFRQIFPLYTEKNPVMKVPVGLACEDPLIWYGSEVKRKKKLLTFMNHHICENTTDVINESNTSNRSTSTPPPAAANDDPGSIQGIQEEGQNRDQLITGPGQFNIVGCNNVHIVLPRPGECRQVQMGTPTSPENNPDDRYDIIEDGPEETSSLQGQGLGQEDVTQTHFRSNSSSSASDEWHDAVTHHPDCDATLTHPKSIASEEGRANSHLELPALGLAELDLNRDQGSGRKEGRSCEDYAKSPANQEKVSDLPLIALAAKSVGLISSVLGSVGTGFRVGTRYIMTAAHVLAAALDYKQDFSSEENIKWFQCMTLANETLVTFDLKIDFLWAENCERKTYEFKLKSVRYVSTKFDVAIIEAEEGIISLAPFTTFLDTKVGKCEFHFLGYDEAQAVQRRDYKCQTVTKLEAQEKKQELLKKGVPQVYLDRYDIMGDCPDFLHFQCSFKKGGSGSPGIKVHDYNKVSVMTMLLSGYPKLPPDFTGQFKIHLRVEEGVRMWAIKEDLKVNDLELCHEIFGKYVEDGIHWYTGL